MAEPAAQYQPVRVFAVSGRIGRARYITYSFGLFILIGIVGGLLGMVIGEAASLVTGVAAIVVGFMLTIQRCHDFNTSGWLALLILVPLANLVFWFIPGSDGPNRFGKPTPPNSVLTLILVWILPIFFVAGILAAIAIPAYQTYLKRAQQVQPR